MNESLVYGKLETVFRSVFNDDSIQVYPELSPDKLLLWDSLMHLRLLLSIEKAFNIRFSTSEIESLRNAGDLAAVIRARVRQSSLPTGHNTADMNESIPVFDGAQK